MSVINEEKIKNRLDAILRTIQTEADPQLLNQYRALIRKNVSFFQRSYLAAYLLMLQEQPQGRQRESGGDKSRNKSKGRNNSVGAESARETAPARQARRPEQQVAQPPASVALPEDEAVRLFISIGRNRRVFPREILGLIGSRTSVSKEDIGTINILNNYSFVQVRNSAAAEIVETLNGASFRGRTLTVNYARTRQEEEGDVPAESSFKPSDGDFSSDPVLRPLEDDVPGPDVPVADAPSADAVDTGAMDTDVTDTGYGDVTDTGARDADAVDADTAGAAIDGGPADADEPVDAADYGESTDR
jgi:hypothetical protein